MRAPAPLPRLLAAFALAATALSVRGQCITSVYESFWFAAPDVDASHGDEPLLLRIAAYEEDVAWRVSMPAQPAFPVQTGTVSAGSLSTLDLTPHKALVEVGTPDAVTGGGILVEVTGTGLPYYEVAHANNPAIINLKGDLGLGTDFFTPFQDLYPNKNDKNGRSGFLVTASQDNTTVTITPRVDLEGHAAADGPFTVTLDRGQTWLGLALGKAPSDRLVGTRIQADRKVAVTLYDDNVHPAGSGNYDLSADQLVPVHLTGREHVVVAAGAGPREHAFVLATEDGTRVFADGDPTPLDTLDAGEQFTFPVTAGAHFLETDRPVYVLQLTGIGGEMGYSLLPPMNCTGLSRVGFYRTSAASWRPVVIADSAAIGAFLVDGNPWALIPSDFSPVPGTGNRYYYSYNGFTVGAGQEHFIENDAGNFHFGVVNNLGASCETGFYSWFGPSKPYLGADRVLCSNDLFPLTLRPNVVADSYLWNDGSTRDSLVITAQGTYTVQASYGACGTSYDTVVIVVDTLPTVALTGDSVEAVCVDGTVAFDLTNPALTAGSDAGTITYHLSEAGAQAQSDAVPDPTAVEPGVYWLRLTTECLCYSTRQVIVWTDCTPLLADDLDSTELEEPVTVAVLANDTDPWGALDSASVTLLDAPHGGLATLSPGGLVTYTPDPGYWSPDSFRYRACDVSGQCETAWVRIEVLNTWLAPVTVPDAYTLDEDETGTWAVLANDIDSTGAWDTAGMWIQSGPANGSASLSPEGLLTYTPAPDWFGTDVLTYVLCDTFGLCDSALVTITVLPVNDPPLAGEDSLATDEDVAAVAVVLANDTDVDGFVDGASVSVVGDPARGTATVYPSGSIGYAPDADAFGADSLRYRVCDNEGACDTAWLRITVRPVNDPPVAADDVLITAEDLGGTAAVLANDTDIDSDLDTASLALIRLPANGTASVLPGGTVAFTPAPDWNGSDSLRYRICDVEGLCDSATLRLIATPVNDPPILVDDAATVDEDENAVVDVLANDSDPDGFLDPASVTLVGLPAFGTATVTPGGQVKLTPPADWTGVDSFRYRACDDGGLCDTATGVVTVLPLADPPSAVADTLWTDEDVAAGLDPLANDSDPEGDLDPASFSVLAGPYTGAIAVGPGSWLTYAPPADWSGRDSLRYRVCDLAGACAEARVLVLVAPVPDAPVAVDDAALTAEGTAVTVDATANDTDVERDLDASSLTVVVPPSAGTALLTATPGQLLYQPDPGAFGRDSLRYRVCDATGLCDSAWVRVAVGEVPVAPDLQPDEASVEGDAALPLDLLANDVPGDYPFLPGSVAVVTPPANGTAGVDPLGGTVTYTAAFGFCGTDSFAYAACDGWGYCDTAWVTVTVLCFPPEAVDDARSGPAGDRPLVAVLDNDYAGTGGWDTASLALRFAPAHGTLEATGAAWRYVPLSDAWCGADSFGYRVANRYGLADSAVVRVTLSCAPFEARDDTARTAEATPVAIDWRANDDAEADPASFFLVTPPENGLVVGGASGVLEYRPDAGFTGTECFTYRVTATDGLRSDEAAVCVRVDPVLALPDLPDLITPNGDGKNDRFDVGNLDRYPHASLTVINRWETVVYTAAPYPGDWDGTHQATGQPLPSGTYYIIFRFDDTDPASPTVQQALTILR